MDLSCLPRIPFFVQSLDAKSPSLGVWHKREGVDFVFWETWSIGRTTGLPESWQIQQSFDAWIIIPPTPCNGRYLSRPEQGKKGSIMRTFMVWASRKKDDQRGKEKWKETFSIWGLTSKFYVILRSPCFCTGPDVRLSLLYLWKCTQVSTAYNVAVVSAIKSKMQIDLKMSMVN